MHMIEETLGREIVRVSTDDVDVMEEVCTLLFCSALMVADHLFHDADSQEALEMKKELRYVRVHVHVLTVAYLHVFYSYIPHSIIIWV